MNSKKAKKLRKALNSAGSNWSTEVGRKIYTVDNGQVRAKGMRGAYIAAKKGAKKAGLI